MSKYGDLGDSENRRKHATFCVTTSLSSRCEIQTRIYQSQLELLCKVPSENRSGDSPSFTDPDADIFRELILVAPYLVRKFAGPFSCMLVKDLDIGRELLVFRPSCMQNTAAGRTAPSYCQSVGVRLE